MPSRPLKYHGGKDYLAEWIIAHYPPRESWTHYCETHAGGLATLFEHDYEGISEAVNDISCGLSNFWSVLREPDCFEMFRRLVETTPFSERVFEGLVDGTPSKPLDVEAAWVFFVRFRQSRQGIGRSFATLSKRRTRRGMNEQVSSWLSAVEGLPEAHKRLKRVVICNADAIDFIKREDSERTFFYVDPTYLHETRSAPKIYKHEMTQDQHGDLLMALDEIEGKFLLSGYPSQMYSDWASAVGWKSDSKEIDNKASSSETKEKKTEMLWYNY